MSTSASDHRDQRNARLAELEATRRQIEAYQALLQEVPTVFERKFRERMQAVLERNREIAAESQVLREQLAVALPPATATEAPSQLPADSPKFSNPSQRAHTPVRDRIAGWAKATGRPKAAGRPKAMENAPVEAACSVGPFQGLKRLSWPRRWPRPLLWGAAGVATIGLSLLVLAPLSRQLPLTQLSKLLNLAPADPNALRPDQLEIISNGSWVEVEEATGNQLYAGILEGERRFTIGPGLRLNAGRPDLVRYRIGNRPAAPLGAIEDVGWRTLASPLQNPAAVPALETSLPQP